MREPTYIILKEKKNKGGNKWEARAMRVCMIQVNFQTRTIYYLVCDFSDHKDILLLSQKKVKTSHHCVSVCFDSPQFFKLLLQQSSPYIHTPHVCCVHIHLGRVSFPPNIPLTESLITCEFFNNGN